MPVIIIIAFFQISLVCYFLHYILNSFRNSKRKEALFRSHYNTVSFLISILLIFCFLLNAQMEIASTSHFFGLTSLTFTGLICNWFAKAEWQVKAIKYPLLCLSSALFWLSLFATVTLAKLLALIWIPFLGLFTTIPLLLTLIVLSDIIYEARKIKSIPTIFILIAGFGPLLIFQYTTNLYTAKNLTFLEIFTLK